MKTITKSTGLVWFILLVQLISGSKVYTLKGKQYFNESPGKYLSSSHESVLVGIEYIISPIGVGKKDCYSVQTKGYTKEEIYFCLPDIQIIGAPKVAL